MEQTVLNIDNSSSNISTLYSISDQDKLVFLTSYFLTCILLSNLLAYVLRCYQASLPLLGLTPLNLLNSSLIELNNLWVTSNSLGILYRLLVAPFSFVAFQLAVVVNQTLACTLCGLASAMAILRLLYVTRFSEVICMNDCMFQSENYFFCRQCFHHSSFDLCHVPQVGSLGT
jgi:hypothetical protein